MAFLLFAITLHLKDPFLLKVRNIELAGILTICSIMGGGTLYQIRSGTNRHVQRLERSLFFTMIGVVMLTAIVGEIHFRFKKYTILHTDREQLRKLGRHFIVGYRHTEEIVPLIVKGAIGGIFITRRNVHGKSAEQIQQEIEFLQELRTSSGLPPLFVAADQEGGIVSRLSPPLSSLPALSLLAGHHILSRGTIETNVKKYAEIHGRELKNIGVNVNLSPVVDLKLRLAHNPLNVHTRIQDRAISADASTVAQVALTYSQHLERCGVIPTVKHFPGLGRIATDTHHFLAELDTSVKELQRRDWIPFREVITRSHAFMMLGHVTLSEIDPDNPVSYSQKVIQTIIREHWNHDGVLITDDFTMGPIYRGKKGIGYAAVSALNAGVDLILISYDGEKYYDAMYAVLQAVHKQRLDNAKLQKSKQRVKRVMDEVLE